ncbi:amidoligase family protein [Kordiimonas lipolytica]|uniref:Amidoligase family protein n=1 Tax=Kordiimonas lipolytica TaxID=1662421 RepID=A0ABV8UA39_9PROT|nr:amidoligase family protein [Kordiimonas lipolytica]
MNKSAAPNDTGEKSSRKIGVEIEFAGLTPDQAADVVASALGGEPKQTDLYFWTVEETELGDIDVELDTQFVKAGNNPLQEALEAASEELGIEIRRLIGSASEGLVPTEIVSPPIPVSSLPGMDKLVDALRQAGAKDSSGSPLFAFGLHLNPEVTGKDVAAILPTFKAYMLMSAWLRDQIGIDLARKALPYIDPFPVSYVKHATRADYTPDLNQLIDDYLDENATRNRELDMLPLFAHLDEERVRKRVNDPRIKPRPTYHYRLPEARLSSPDWSIGQEWDRWLLVEKLAGDADALTGLAELFTDTPPRKWLEASSSFLSEWREG